MTLPCDEFELQFGQPQMKAELALHAEHCPRCQLTKTALSLSALAPVTAVLSNSLEARTLAASVQSKNPVTRKPAIVRPTSRRWLTHAMAAGIGAFLASGAWLSFKANSALTAQPPVVASRLAVDENEDNLAEEAVLIEMSWPDADGY